MKNEEKRLTTQAAASQLGVSLITLYRYINDIEDKLPCYKISPSKIWILQSDLDKWVESHRNK
jgi:excisionase family DNA binding protein